MVTLRMWTTRSCVDPCPKWECKYKRSFLRHIRNILHLAIYEGYIYSKLTIRIFYWPNDITQNQTNFQNKINNSERLYLQCINAFIHETYTLTDLDTHVQIKVHVKKSQIPNIVIISHCPKNWISCFIMKSEEDRLWKTLSLINPFLYLF